MSQHINLKMNSRGRKSVTPKRKTPSKDNSASGKENSRAVSSISSGKKVEDLINGMRISACKTITNVKSSFGDLSCKLRQSTVKAHRFSKTQNYEELGEQVTPVKLYSPFTFVTPSPDEKPKKRISPKRFAFASPTGKFQKDVKQLSREIKELERVEKRLSTRKLR